MARRGFDAPPDVDGTVEVDYRVAPAWRRQGLATLAGGRAARLRARPGRGVLPGQLLAGNDASLADVRRLGFVGTGEQLDEIDGLELVHTLELR